MYLKKKVITIIVTCFRRSQPNNIDDETRWQNDARASAATAAGRYQNNTGGSVNENRQSDQKRCGGQPGNGGTRPSRTATRHQRFRRGHRALPVPGRRRECQ